MPEASFRYKLILSFGIVFSVALCVRSQNLETSKRWLRQEQKDQLKTSIVSGSEYKELTPKTNVLFDYKLINTNKKEKYTVEYLNRSIKMGIENIQTNPPSLSDAGAGVIVGGLNLSDPKAWFMAAKLKKRKRKMLQITTCVYWVED